MSYTYTGGRNLAGKITNNSTSANLSLADTFIDQFTFEAVHKFPSIAGERTDTSLQTLPAVQFIQVPRRIRKINTVTVSVGSFQWFPKECPTVQYWNQLNLSSNIQSDIPEWWFFYNGQLGFYPRPSSGYHTITIRHQVEALPLSFADYTTGTITTVPYTTTFTGVLASGATSGTLSAVWALTTGSYQILFSNGELRLATLTSGSAAVTFTALTSSATATVTISTSTGGSIVVGSGTTFTSAMVGYFLQVTVANGGDNLWYEISNYYDATHIALKEPWSAGSIASGSASFTIGQSSMLKEGYQLYPIYRFAEVFYTTLNPDPTRAAQFKALADGLEALMKDDMGNKSTDVVVEDTRDAAIVNPNLVIRTADGD